jgi:hypothetical protein
MNVSTIEQFLAVGFKNGWIAEQNGVLVVSITGTKAITRTNGHGVHVATGTAGRTARIRGRSRPIQAIGTRTTTATRGARKATRGGAGNRDVLLTKVLGVVQQKGGVAVSDVAKAVGIPKPKAGAILKALKVQNKIFQGGERRFARYATTQAAANNAAKNAQTSTQQRAA